MKVKLQIYNNLITIPFLIFSDEKRSSARKFILSYKNNSLANGSVLKWIVYI